jgi:hypothetical protein
MNCRLATTTQSRVPPVSYSAPLLRRHADTRACLQKQRRTLERSRPRITRGTPAGALPQVHQRQRVVTTRPIAQGESGDATAAKGHREQTIYFRRVPRVPSRLLGDTELVLLRELSIQPGSLATHRTGLAVARLAPWRPVSLTWNQSCTAAFDPKQTFHRSRFVGMAERRTLREEASFGRMTSLRNARWPRNPGRTQQAAARPW